MPAKSKGPNVGNVSSKTPLDSKTGAMVLSDNKPQPVKSEMPKTMPAQFQSDNFYTVLGVSKDASKSEIRKAYKNLARENHPDKSKHPLAEQIFLNIKNAHDHLTDDKKRKEHDNFLRAPANHSQKSKVYTAPYHPAQNTQYTDTEIKDSVLPRSKAPYQSFKNDEKASGATLNTVADPKNGTSTSYGFDTSHIRSNGTVNANKIPFQTEKMDGSKISKAEQKIINQILAKSEEICFNKYLEKNNLKVSKGRIVDSDGKKLSKKEFESLKLAYMNDPNARNNDTLASAAKEAQQEYNEKNPDNKSDHSFQFEIRPAPAKQITVGDSSSKEASTTKAIEPPCEESSSALVKR